MFYSVACNQCTYQGEPQKAPALEIRGMPHDAMCPWCRSIDWRYVVSDCDERYIPKPERAQVTVLPVPSDKILF